MAVWASAAMSAAPWATVATVALVLLFLAYVIAMVRGAKSGMTVRISWKCIEIRRGPADTAARPARRLRSVDAPESGADNAERSG